MINAFYYKNIAFLELVHLIKEIAQICNIHRYHRERSREGKRERERETAKSTHQFETGISIAWTLSKEGNNMLDLLILWMMRAEQSAWTISDKKVAKHTSSRKIDSILFARSYLSFSLQCHGKFNEKKNCRTNRR